VLKYAAGMGSEFSGWGKKDFVRWLRKHYPAPSAPEHASWVFVLRFTHPADMLLLTGEGFVFEFTASGGYEDCIRELAAELADLAEEPFVKLEIRIYPGKRRGGRRGFPRGG